MADFGIPKEQAQGWSTQYPSLPRTNGINLHIFFSLFWFGLARASLLPQIVLKVGDDNLRNVHCIKTQKPLILTKAKKKGQQRWEPLCRVCGTVFDFVNPPRGSILLRFQVGVNWITPNIPIPSNWKPKATYGTKLKSVVCVLVELLMDDKAGITDDALAVLASLLGYFEGLKEIRNSRALVTILIDLLRFGSVKGKENSITLLLGLCNEEGEVVARRLLENLRSIPSLQSLASNGSLRARRKANALLRLLNRCCSQPHHSV